MKKYSLLFLMALFLTSLNLSVYASNADIAANKPTIAKHVFGVHGLSCPFCVIGIKKTFKKINGVQSVKVSIKHNSVTVFTDKGICFSEEELKTIISKAGFSYHGTISTPDGCKKRL